MQHLLNISIFEQVGPSFLFLNIFFCEALSAQKIAQKKILQRRALGGGLGTAIPLYSTSLDFSLIYRSVFHRPCGRRPLYDIHIFSVAGSYSRTPPHLLPPATGIARITIRAMQLCPKAYGRGDNEHRATYCLMAILESWDNTSTYRKYIVKRVSITKDIYTKISYFIPANPWVKYGKGRIMSSMDRISDRGKALLLFPPFRR